MAVILVALGAAVGAPLRYLVDRAVQGRHDSVFPWGTLVVNVVGSLLLGVLIGGAAVGTVPGSLVNLLGLGLCGALTTYSTFGYETIRLLEDGARFPALVNAGVSVVAALGAAFVGVALAEALWA
ncbi:fluoride efflux transporter FluC [Micromonospora sediminimaris]|uniref:Fluoride-specific ion channel FluC n=1 Tax=Micromonospora sediminimaris TaxID=547162 RepID=A0A9W5XJ22_9ACTN|nr:CrcB family protein [Micromonospora sediminimaris]GIJ32494.1 putative fluoride ion transporter CrcB 2 [Micromonospora sediminimaris]SFD36447.1 CrcB protein [Micromonospora sediminimaris]